MKRRGFLGAILGLPAVPVLARLPEAKQALPEPVYGPMVASNALYCPVSRSVSFAMPLQRFARMDAPDWRGVCIPDGGSTGRVYHRGGQLFRVDEEGDIHVA